MKLFNFLKKKAVYDFETLLQKAADEPAHRVEFIKRILTEELVVITNNSEMKDGYIKASKDTNVGVLTFDDGRVPVFTSTDRIFDKGVIKEQIKFLAIKGEALFNMLKGKSLVLNPYSDYGKEFTAEEVNRILNGTYFKSREIVVKKATEVRIGQPAKYPTDVVKSLVNLFRSRPHVTEAYLAWIHDPASLDPPHYIFAIKTTGDWRTISDEAGFLVQQILGSEEIIDFFQLKKDGFLNEYFINQTKPFYTKAE